MVHKAPRQAELLVQMSRQRLHAEGFRGVMAAVKDVNAKFLGQGVAPVRAFAGR